MQSLEVSGAVRPIYGSLDVKRLTTVERQVSDTRWHSWLRHCVTSRKVARLIPVGVTGIFNWPNSSGHPTALGSIQLLTEMSTQSIFSGPKRPVPSADNLTTFMYRLSRNSGSLQPSGHFQACVTIVLNSYVAKISWIRWNLQNLLGVFINVLWGKVFIREYGEFECSWNFRTKNKTCEKYQGKWI